MTILRPLTCQRDDHHQGTRKCKGCETAIPPGKLPQFNILRSQPIRVKIQSKPDPEAEILIRMHYIYIIEYPMKYLHDILSTGWFLYPSFHLPFSNGGRCLWTPKLRRGTINSTAMVMAQIICQEEAGQKPMDFDNPWMNGSYFNG